MPYFDSSMWYQINLNETNNMAWCVSKLYWFDFDFDNFGSRTISS